jgi:hypothetical protein
MDQAMVLSPHELAIARSVIYASLFDYPLTPDQLHQTLLESDQSLSEILETFASSKPLQAVIEFRDGFFFPAGRGSLVDERRTREARSRTFLAQHHRFLQLVCAMPYTRLVALSGSIAHLNLECGGDLDLFIVTRQGHVWGVTVALLLLAKLMRRRRTLCANFVIADSHLWLEQQELFTANQVIHLKPLIGEAVFRQLLAANPFIGRLYPNFRGSDASRIPFQPNRALGRGKHTLEVILAMPSSIAEGICRRAYSAYLRRRSASWRSAAQVRLLPDYLKLHSQSHRQSILERFDRAVCEALRRADVSVAQAVGS